MNIQTKNKVQATTFTNMYKTSYEHVYNYSRVIKIEKQRGRWVKGEAVQSWQ